MGQTVKDVTLSTRAARAKLAVSGKPYYRAIDHGLHLGYRKGKQAGKWVARYAAEKQYRLEAIGLADDTQEADGLEVFSFSQAQEKAREIAKRQARISAGLPSVEDGSYTVRKALDDYVEFLAHHKKSAADARNRADRLISPALGTIAAADLTTDQIRKWLRELAAKAPRLRTKKTDAKGKPVKQRYREFDKDDDEARRRRRASANRTLTTFKAALNYAWREGKVADDTAWRKVEPFEAVDAARLRYLTVDEAAKLIAASEPDFQNLVRAALQTGCRYGELCRLDVSDFNPDSNTIAIRKPKSNKPRHVILTEEGAEFFAAICKDRKASSPMLVKWRIIHSKEIDGIEQPDTFIESRWSKSQQSRPIAEACKAAEIDPPISFHGLRHTYASLSVMAGVPLMVVAKQLGHVDTRMVEKHYGHLAPSYVAEAVRSMAPRFGVVRDNEVTGMEKVR